MPRLRFGSALGFSLVIALMLVAASCGGGDDEGGGTRTVGGQKANDHGSEDVSGENELDLELDDFYFSPTVLTGSAGEKLTLHLGNEGTTEHNFSVTELGVDQDVESDGKTDVTVTFPDSGTLVFFCKYHQNMGMRGALQVA